MVQSYRLAGGTLAAAGLIVGALAEFNYRRLPLAGSRTGTDRGKVSVIIPARNEERRICPLLTSLRDLDYVNYEVVVVNDCSDDSTADLARQLGAEVISVDSLPEGWTGKNYACWLGAFHTSGEWLLFTDADTVHHPHSLSTAVAEAKSRNLGLVSFLCRQQCITFWERLLLPYAYALYFVGRLRINASTRSAVANGQYILISRAAYEIIGGHQAVRGSVIDDVALAQQALKCHVPAMLFRGEHLVDVRMYEGLVPLWEGLSKNAVYFLAASPLFGALTVAASLVFGASIRRVVGPRSSVERATVYAAPAIALLPWIRRFGVPDHYAMLYPLGAVMFQLIAFDSIRRSWLHHGVQWKGRSY